MDATISFRLFWVTIAATAAYIDCVNGFVETTTLGRRNTFLRSSALENPTDDPAIQWELFNKHHAKGSWKGVWYVFFRRWVVIFVCIGSECVLYISFPSN